MARLSVADETARCFTCGWLYGSHADECPEDDPLPIYRKDYDAPLWDDRGNPLNDAAQAVNDERGIP